MRFVLVAGTTETATSPGLTAAGAAPRLVAHTPAADAEILEYGRPVRAPVTPVSPSGCPTPAIVTRAVRELLAFDTLVVDAGLATSTAAPTVSVGDGPGADVREPTAVPDAAAILERSTQLGRSLPDDRLLLAECVPGGTTTALGVLTALGYDHPVSSSLPQNPLERKRAVVRAALEASGIEPPVVDPLEAVRALGDPVQAAVTGLACGALDRGASVTLAGGTQMVAVAALLRALDRGERLTLATTRYVAEDTDLDTAMADLDLDFVVTDPGFDRLEDHPLRQYCAGEAKEGVGMGGALWLARERDVSMAAVRDRTRACYDRLVGDDGP